MKINRTGYAQFVQKLENSRQTRETNPKMEGKDSIELSDASRKIKAYADSLKAMQAKDADKVESIKAKLQAGTYKVSSKELAERILFEIKSQAEKDE